MKRKARVLKKFFLFMCGVVLIMGMNGCSFVSQEGEMEPETFVEPPATDDGNRGTIPPQTEAAETVSSEEKISETAFPETEVSENDGEEFPKGDPVVGIVDKYGDNVIVIRDGSDEDLIYCFSTQNAQVEEGNSPIAPGDMVEITYRGVMGDEEHPGEAVKVVRLS